MKRDRFTEEQIIAVLREGENGTPVKDVCRRAGISTVTFYKWQSKYAGMEISEMRRSFGCIQPNQKLEIPEKKGSTDHVLGGFAWGKAKSQPPPVARYLRTGTRVCFADATHGSINARLRCRYWPRRLHSKEDGQLLSHGLRSIRCAERGNYC